MRIGWRQLYKHLTKKPSEFHSVGIEYCAAGFHLSVFSLVDGKPRWIMQHHIPMDNMTNELTDWVAEHNLKNTPCNIAISTEKYQVLQVDKPAVPDEELGQALPWAIKDLLPNEDEMVVDYFNLPAQTMGAEKINVVAFPKAEIVEIARAVQKSGLDLQHVGVEELVTCDLVDCSQGAVISVFQGKGQEVCLNIVKDKKLYFSRRLKGYEKLSSFSAEEIRMGIGDNLSIEIQRSMDYFEGQLRQAGVKKIYISMDTEHQQVLADIVKQLTLLDVEPFSPEIDKSDDLLFEQANYTSLAAALTSDLIEDNEEAA